MKAYPVLSQFPLPPIQGWTPPRQFSTESTTCKFCQEPDLYWQWSFYLKKSILINPARRTFHRCTASGQKDVFPGWCDKCQAADLLWIRKTNGFELTESYGLPHSCEVDPPEDISHTTCKHCSQKDLLWTLRGARYTLVDTRGIKHNCPAYPSYMKDWAEALRMNYAAEKAWLKAIPDDTPCKKCKGFGVIIYTSKSKKNLQKYNSSEPIRMSRPCVKCKQLGTFTALKKKAYLKDLRKKYWPFRIGFHKWKKHKP